MLQNNFEFTQIHTTTDNSKLAKEIAKELIALKLITCAHIISNITSIYTWEDKLEENEEKHNLIKICLDNSISQLAYSFSFTFIYLITF